MLTSAAFSQNQDSFPFWSDPVLSAVQWWKPWLLGSTGFQLYSVTLCYTTIPYIIAGNVHNSLWESQAYKGMTEGFENCSVELLWMSSLVSAVVSHVLCIQYRFLPKTDKQRITQKKEKKRGENTNRKQKLVQLLIFAQLRTALIGSVWIHLGLGWFWIKARFFVSDFWFLSSFS